METSRSVRQSKIQQHFMQFSVTNAKSGRSQPPFTAKKAEKAFHNLLFREIIMRGGLSPWKYMDDGDLVCTQS